MKTEEYGIGLVIRMNEKPVPLVSERLMEHEELNSFEQGSTFKYSEPRHEHRATLKDF